ncbi:MAG: hypothetical protein Q4G67_00250 [Actinomycetia bacterium]|nr:hypothetical protein [Actinomycetes bacterium]
MTVVPGPPRSAAWDDSSVLVPPLHPSLSPWPRPDGAIQLGHDPVHGVILTGLAEGEVSAVVLLLDTLTTLIEPVSIDTLSCATGLSPARVGEIAELLAESALSQPAAAGPCDDAGISAWEISRRRWGGESGLLERSPVALSERRAGTRVIIDGRSALVDQICALLVTAGVGSVRAGWYAGAADELLDDDPDPTLVITIGARLPRWRATEWQTRSVAHLPVLARDTSVDIGPLIIPGRGPCVECLRRHDSTWSASPFAVDDPLTDGQSDLVRVEPTLAAIAAGAVGMLALAHLDAYPPPLGSRWHCALPLPSLATSRWGPHPQCPAAQHRPVPRPGRATIGAVRD